MTHTTDIKQWEAAEDRLDMIIELIHDLDVLEGFGVAAAGSDEEREVLEAQYDDAEREVHDAKVAYYRAEGDDETADSMESERLHAELTPQNIEADPAAVALIFGVWPEDDGDA